MKYGKKKSRLGSILEKETMYYNPNLKTRLNVKKTIDPFFHKLKFKNGKVTLDNEPVILRVFYKGKQLEANCD